MTNADIGISIGLDTDNLKRGIEESKHALGGLADFTKGALTAGFAVGVAGVAALGAGLGLSVKAAMEAQQAEAQLDAVLKSTGEASKKRMAEYVAAQGKVVTVNVLSKKEQEKLTKENQKATDAYNKLGDKLKTAAAKLQDMEKRMQATKEPTASATLALERQRKTVADLEAEIARGVPTLGAFATKSMTLAESLGLTPPVAQMTKEELLKLASSLQSVTTVGDEAILGAESMILTFTNIGKEIFPQVTETVLDMATAMNGGATPSAEQLRAQAIQLGKALNNPKEGLTALTRVGVTFTEAQKEQIKAMVDAGDTMGAQKIILAELAGEFGGSARAAADTFGGKLEQLTNIAGDLEEKIGMALIPILTTLAEKAVEFLGSEGVQNFINGLASALERLAKGDVKSVLEDIFDKETAKAILDIATQIKTFAEDNLPKLQTKAEEVFGKVKDAVLNFWKEAKPKLDEFVKWLNTDGVDALQVFFDQVANLEKVTLPKWNRTIEEMGKTWTLLFGPNGKIKTDSEITLPTFAELVDLVMERGRLSFETKLDFIQIIFQTFNDVLVGDWNRVFKTDLPGILEEGFDLLLGMIYQDGEQLRQAFQDKMDEIVESFRNGGRQMLQGLIDGLWSNASAVTDALGSIIQQAIDAALSVFGGGGGPTFAGEMFGGGPAPMLPPGNSMNFGGITINFNGENAPRTQAEADQSASLFINALRSKGYAV